MHAVLLFLASLAGLGAPQEAARASAAPAASPERPNILLIMADDLGWMDLRCQGNTRLDTPHIDHLASQGMRFRAAYAAAPVCSPTRAAIMTGLSPARLHLTTHIPGRFLPADAAWLPAETLLALPPERVTLAERLARAGYRTAFLGKWHLAGDCTRAGKGLGDLACYPERQGFQLNLGGCAYGGPPTYFDPYRIHNLASRRPGEYLPDRLADEAIAFMRAAREQPFFVCLWNYAVHWPMEAKQAALDKYAGREGLRDHRYAAMIACLDAAIGRVLAALDELAPDRPTVVIFTSDNGGYLGVTDNHPLRLGKGYLYEGGLRVPLIVRWPGVVRPGTLCEVPVILTDLFPTLLAAAGLERDRARPCDGEDLGPLLRGAAAPGRRALHFHFPNYAWHMKNRLGGAVRAGRYKLIEHYDDGSVELYDLERDLGEQRDLASRMPARAEALRVELHAWLERSGALMPRRRSRPPAGSPPARPRGGRFPPP